MSDEKKVTLPGEPGHFRYAKALARDEVRATHGSAPICKNAPKKEVASKEVASKEVMLPSFTREGAKKLTRPSQKKILKARGIKFSSKDKEADLIEKIINSNPKE